MKSVLRKSVIIGGRRDDTGKAEPVIQNLDKTDAMQNRTDYIKNDVPSTIKNGVYGCRNCLWAGVECKGGSKYQPVCHGCVSYTYYD